MRLLRVQVPEFRALKDVDISFEPEFSPQVFPLGSLNGGGKSTLLQLIFVLLHCSAHKERHQFIKNILEKFTIEKNNQDKLLAEFEILDEVKFNLKFIVYNSADSNENSFFNKIEIKKNIVEIYLKNLTLICELSNIDLDCKEVLEKISSHIFLLSPSNQIYLFLFKIERLVLFNSNSEKSYEQILRNLKNILPNFFTYDSINLLTAICRLARDKDFDEKLETGSYGTHYEKLENVINNLFIDGKKITPLTIQQKRHTTDSIQSMGFKLLTGEEIDPEDLSHGELKRLAIFILFKYYEIENSIVLMDEIESAFHPRWQRYIVDDLMEWGETNQYILATHSYQVCDGVTPAHIKELPPHLLPKN